VPAAAGYTGAGAVNTAAGRAHSPHPPNVLSAKAGAISSESCSFAGDCKLAKLWDYCCHGQLLAVPLPRPGLFWAVLGLQRAGRATALPQQVSKSLG